MIRYGSAIHSWPGPATTLRFTGGHERSLETVAALRGELGW
jgi:hypothetical protein